MLFLDLNPTDFRPCKLLAPVFADLLRFFESPPADATDRRDYKSDII